MPADAPNPHADTARDPAVLDPASEERVDRLLWFGRGMAQIVSVPALVLMAAFVGFAGLARESGVPVQYAAMLTALVWALPSTVIMVAAIKSNATLFAAMLAVSLSAVRLMPMTMALVPILRGPRTRTITLLALSHFVAVTSWVFGMTQLPALPRDARVPYYAGFAITLTTVNIGVTVVAYIAAGALPPALAAALSLLTPLYFILSLWGASRLPSDRLALVFGMVLAPVMNKVSPDYELLLVGLIGGSAAYGIGRWTRRRGGAEDGGGEAA
ncbi:AzlC family ABC transporter permease [Methyloraptor flagellatus]|uniref:AzlC family ABC transporter permease n=1 Tax=Methyloraptor flagellatus TaxID=3162530 RepID=A0AAU7XD09_9HYPH